MTEHKPSSIKSYKTQQQQEESQPTTTMSTMEQNHILSPQHNVNDTVRISDIPPAQPDKIPAESVLNCTV